MYPFGQEVLFGFAGWDLLNVFCIQPLTPKWLKPIVTKLALEQNELSCPGLLLTRPIPRVDRLLTLIQLLTLTHTRSGDIYIEVYIKLRYRGHKLASKEYSNFAGKAPI